jgi:iron complex outermembrane recepter protein
MSKKQLSACGVALSVLLCSAGQSYGQDVAPEVGEKAVPKNRLLEEVVVTARKREESVQDVPIAIAAFSGEKLDAFGIESAQQLDKITPGLVFGSVIGFTTVFLRGVGSDAYLPSADPSVPIYVDDISSLPSQGSIDALVNVERVEVLKGPQGTLFGRNALGGAIRIVTPDPNPETFVGLLKFEAGHYDEVGADNYSGSFFVNVPIFDNLAATVSGIYRDEEAIYTNETGQEVSDNTLRGGRIKIKWYATDRLDFTLSGIYDEAASSAGLAAEGTEPAPILCAICTPDSGFDYKIKNSVPSVVRTRRDVVSAYMNWDLPIFTMKAILSDQYLAVPYGFGDLDYTSAPMLVGEVGKQYAEQRTAEFRLESNEETPFSDQFTWVVGAYYLESAGGYDPLFLNIGSNALNLFTDFPVLSPIVSPLLGVVDSLLPGVTGLVNNVDVTLVSYGILETESLSAFAEGTYTLFDRLDLTLGARYDEETRNVDGSRVEIFLPGEIAVPFSSFDVPEATTSRLSPRFSAMWQFDDAQIYASYSIGYLSPTYNTVNFFEAPDFVEQEEDHAFEVGFKGQWLDGQLQMEGALFYTQRYDIITAYTALTSGGAVNFFNAGDGEVKGAELTVQLQPFPELNPGLAVIFSGSYLDATYTDYKDGRGFDEETGLAFGPGSFFGLPAQDYTGNRIVQSPEFTANATILQSLYLGDSSELEVAVDSYFNSGYYFTAQNISVMEQEQYQTFAARISYFYNPWGLQLTAYGENITDERYFASAVHVDFGPGRSLAPPAHYGIRAKWTFE